ncbi:polysaccharide ABC transporter ATP-binding protein [Hyphomonas sp.]|uniref:ABC transporter ATP-binding protein n=1 Tax=Hyphomonas sp. TaxID=87 RepID=UPI001BCC29C1|nr:polysaccharide ABC transporter ATP-binding protein [Hyphomonas sp.]
MNLTLRTMPGQSARESAQPDTAQQIMVDVRNLSKRYQLTSTDAKKTGQRDFWALKDVSFKLEAGERLGIIGHNGAGKSTLLKILSRVINPTAGEAFLYGRSSSLLEVGTGFQPSLTGRQNIYMNAALHGMSRAEMDDKIQAIIDFSEIGQFIDEPVRTYSTGMRSRLGFSVAAHIDPEILMLDEVLSVGDAAFQQKCLGRMDELTGNHRTLIFVSHSIGAVRRFCDRAIWLSKGEVVMDGNVRDVCDAYEGSTMNIAATFQAPIQSAISRNVEASKTQKAALFDEMANGDVAAIVSAKVMDETHQPARSLKIDQKARIEILFDVLKPGLRIEPAIHFRNDKGEMMFVVAYTDPSMPDAFNETGRFRTITELPANLLNEGVHYVTIGLVTADPLVRHQMVEKAIAFSVYEVIGDTTKVARGRYARSFPGGLRPRLDWTTERADD